MQQLAAAQQQGDIYRQHRYSTAMANKSTTAETVPDKNIGGGSRAAGGLGFQADATAYMMTHLLAGQKLGGLSPSIDAAPVAVAAESGGPGDDIRIDLADGRIIEVQVKRGLRRGAELWKALDALAAGIDAHEVDFGLLLTCPQASRTVLRELARDIERLGDGLSDALSAIGREWKDRLDSAGIPIIVCGRIRISALAVTETEGADIRVAQGLLRGIIADPGDAARAWASLAEDGYRLIEYRGRRTLETALHALIQRGIPIRSLDQSGRAAPLLARLLEWTVAVNSTYTVIGIPGPISMVTGWIPIYARILNDTDTSQAEFSEALRRYRGHLDETADRRADLVHGETIGRFKTRCVVLAGPGMGKTTLLTKLARTYAADGYPVLKARLRVLAERMTSLSETFEEALFALGLDKSGVTAAPARAAGLSNWVILLDGLDETGARRSAMARHIAEFTTAHPAYRVIVTSRSINYEAGALSAWHHYALSRLPESNLKESVRKLIGPDDPEAPGVPTIETVAGILEASPASATIVSNPLLLGLATALAYTQGTIGTSEIDLYKRIFVLIETAASERAHKGGLSDAELTRTIDIIGHSLIAHPEQSEEAVLDRVAEILADEMGIKPLAARRNCELAVHYWCETGLLERIHHQDVQMLAFVHKTLGEFAAARFIASAPAASRRALLARAVDLQADPAIEFAAALGCGDDAFAVLFGERDPLPVEIVVRGLSLAGYASASDLAEILGPLVIRAFELLAIESDDWAERIADELRALAPIHGEQLAEVAMCYLDTSTINARLAAWTIMSDACPQTIDTSALLALVREVAAQRDEPVTRKSNPPGLRHLALPPASALRRGFTLAAAGHLLDAHETEIDEALIALFQHPRLNNLGFVSSLQELLRAKGRHNIELQMQSHWYGRANGTKFPTIDFEGYDRAAATTEIIQLTALAGDAKPDPRLIAEVSILPHLSAYLSMTEWFRTPANDVWQWGDKDWRPYEYQVLRAAAHAGIVDPGQLATEAASMLAMREEAKQNRLFAFFQRTATVDIPEADWRRLPARLFDCAAFEAVLHHGSDYLVRLATIILDAGVSQQERRDIVQRTLGCGNGDALWAATHLAEKLPSEDVVEPFLARLEAEPGYGAEYLPGIFGTHPMVAGPTLSAAMRAALWAKRSEVARAAAISLLALGEAPTDVRQMLFDALGHWTANPPAERKVGQAPDPRNEIANAIAAIANPTDAELVALQSYSGGTRGPSKVKILSEARWRERPSFRDAIFGAARDGTLTPRELAVFLTQPVAFTADLRKAALGILADGSKELRETLTGLFDWPGFLDADCAPILDQLLRDDELDLPDHLYTIAQFERQDSSRPKGST